MSVLWEDHSKHDVEQLTAPDDTKPVQFDALNKDDQLFVYTLMLLIACLLVVGLLAWIAVGLVTDAGYVQ